MLSPLWHVFVGLRKVAKLTLIDCNQDVIGLVLTQLITNRPTRHI